MDTTTMMDEFEEAGIAALVRAGEKRQWFFGHLGAAMIAGVRLLRDPDLPGPAALALCARLQALRVSHREWYAPLESRGVAGVSTEPILERLRQTAGILRMSGHPTIYMSAALHVLSRRPSLATEGVVASLVQLHEDARDDDPARHYGHSNYFEWVDEELIDADLDGGQVGSLVALRVAFASLDHLVADQRTEGRTYFFTGEKIHLVTHAHAIATLEELGYPDLASLAGRAQRSLVRLTECSNRLTPSAVESAHSTPFEASFWEQEVPDFSHVVKLAEAVVAHFRRMTEAEREVAGTRLGTLWSLLGIR